MRRAGRTWGVPLLAGRNRVAASDRRRSRDGRLLVDLDILDGACPDATSDQFLHPDPRLSSAKLAPPGVVWLPATVSVISLGGVRAVRGSPRPNGSRRTGYRVGTGVEAHT